MEEEKKRVELCVHTGYSSRKGVGSPSDVVKTAKEMGIVALAICDDYSTAGYTEFHRACEANQIKAIFGATVNVDGNRVVVLAKTKDGVSAINKIISISTPDDKIIDCQNKIEDITQFKECLITIGLLNDNCDNLDYLFKNFDYVGLTERNKLKFDNKSMPKATMEKLVAVSDSYYLFKSDKLLYDTICGSYSYEYRMLRSGNDLLNKMPQELVIDNPLKVLQKIDNNVFYGYPTFLDYPNLISADDFRKLVEKCIKNKNEFKTKEYSSRLEIELDGVIKNNYWNLFYIAYRIAEFAKNKNELIGCRGSASSSLISYALGITPIDPIKWNIPYQSFLGFNVDKIPDIDLNVSPNIHAQMFDFYKTLVGEQNVAGAGYSYMLDSQDVSALLAVYTKQNNRYYDNLEDAKPYKLMNTLYDVDLHPGGFMLKSPNNDFYKYTAIKKVNGVPTTCTDFHYLHDAILKMDVLGHVDLEVLKLLGEKTGIKYEDVPIDDPKVMSLMGGSQALNKKKILNPDGNPFECISEFGSEFMHRVIEVAKPKTINDLVKISGLGHGMNVWNGNAEYLIKAGYTLDDIFGCRDDVFNVLTQKYNVEPSVAFAIMEDVRKGRGVKDVYAEYLIEHKVPVHLIQSLNLIKYMFPKGHAVYYVINALRLAYYKVYYPKEFYTVYFGTSTNKKILDGIMALSNEQFVQKSETNGFNSEELKLISNMFDMIERGYFFENKEEINVVETDDISDIPLF